MRLGEKIMTQRKLRGWSQEELSNQLDVSRQSVSKWESGASVPDLDKILTMSQLFGVTTDYLLTDQTTPAEAAAAQTRCVTREQADGYLAAVRRYAGRMAAAVTALVLSPTPLILMGGLSEYVPGSLSEDMAGGFGVTILLLIVAAAVAVLIRTGMELGSYSFLEQEEFTLQPGLEPVIRQEQAAFDRTFRSCLVTGVTLCITSVLPLMIAAAFRAGDLVYIVCVDILLLLIAAAVCLFVWSGMIHGSTQKLLQEGEYTVAEKRSTKRVGALPGIYWGIVTAIYLGISFYTNAWDRSWIVWPCAGVLFAAVMGIAKAVTAKKE
ncbi:MAG: helix-turn-helix domain-containing protein [Candidatus Avoscillospira sp.]